MGSTITQKILAHHAGMEEVKPGQLINARVDLVLANDITAPLAIQALRRMGAKKVFNREKVVLVPDHFTPAKDIQSAEQVAQMRQFAEEQGLIHWFEGGDAGIEHVLLPEKGMVLPGELVVGADSHTCTYGALGAFSTGVGSTDAAAAMALGEIWLKVPETIKFIYKGDFRPWVGGKDLILYTIGKIGVDGALYKTMEFAGPALRNLSMDGRFTMANMAIEAGAKNGIFHVDEVTIAYLRDRTDRDYQIFSSDADAPYLDVIELDVGDVEPQVSLPHLPSNAVPVSQAKGIRIDQVVIGSCTNGRLEDLEIAFRLVKGRRINPKVRTLIIPGTQEIMLEALRRGWIEAFVKAGAVVCPPTCGPCLGGHMGVLASGEKAIATTNRNFVGRMGHARSEVYLAGPAVAAATAVAGEIIHPDDIEDY